ncbi:MAG: IMP cyclohydrolase [Firmicutes bacterium]|nr:IMP cyclohydrolase [Bacillota bacterium]
MNNLFEILKTNAYPGRGIVLGKSADGKKLVSAYFIMGRSSNSRNRVFVEEGLDLKTQAFDPAKLEDPSLIIYAPVRVIDKKMIVTNGDQTDTVLEGMKEKKDFEASLSTREFEPDAPNYTPRISGLLSWAKEGGSYKMSILKADSAEPPQCRRFFYWYPAMAGHGHFIHTYQGDGNPLPSFAGEPTEVEIKGDIDEFAANVWESLNEDNKVSLFVRYIDMATGEMETRIFNKNE